MFSDGITDCIFAVMQRWFSVQKCAFPSSGLDISSFEHLQSPNVSAQVMIKYRQRSAFPPTPTPPRKTKSICNFEPSSNGDIKGKDRPDKRRLQHAFCGSMCGLISPL